MSRSQRRRRASVVAAVLAALLVPASESRALDPSPGRILTRTGPDSVAVLRALTGAQRKLRDPACRQLLTDFRDGEGRPLAERLEWLNLEATDYIALLYVRDGADSGTRDLCRGRGVAAATRPGSRFVFVCGSAFRHQPARTRENILIHEMLHTLGLEENPPSPEEIDARVARHCGV